MEFRGGLAGGGGLGRSWRGRRAERRSRRAGLHLGMERLEDRVVMSTWAGTDAATNNNWSHDNNWDTPPGTGSDLIFPTGLSGAALTSNDDITSGSFGSLTINDNNYNITGSTNVTAALAGSVDFSASGTSTVALPISFSSGSGTATVDTAGATLDLSGLVTASSGLTKQGLGTLDLAANDGTMPVTVGKGTLLVAGTAGGITVDSGATLSGTGTVASIGTSSGTVSPGVSSATTGVLTATGAVTLDSNSTFAVTLGGGTVGTNYDQLSAGGAIDLAGATLSVSTGSFVPTTGEQFTIIHNTSGTAITGTFAGLANGTTLTAGGNTFVINYQGGASGQDVVLTAVTPPTVTWSGGDVTTSTNWSDGNNWLGGAAPVAGDTIIFPSGLTGGALTSNDDIPSGSFASVLIQGGGYTITGGSGITAALTGSIDASYGSGSSSLNLPVDFGSSTATVTVDNQGGGLKIGGVVAGTAGLTKQGAGVLDLQATNSYTGTTTVAAGALLVDGSVGAVSVSSGATLGGAGTVASISTNAGNVSPGDSSTLTGILTTSGGATLDGGSTFTVTINGITAGTNYDQLATAGAINLANVTLNLSDPSFNPVPGQEFTIIHNTSGSAITTTFNGLAEGGTIAADGHSFSITYTGGAGGQDVVLTAVNAPTLTWSGTDAIGSAKNDNWSDPANWTANTKPVAGDTLIFPSGLSGAALTSNNDIANTSFFSLDIEAGGYTIQGDGITLAGSIDANQSGSLSPTSSTVSLPITFNTGAGTITVDNAGATLLLSGVVSAPSGLVKQGQGTLSLTNNDGSTPAVVNAGTLLVDGAAGNISANSGGTIGGSGTVAAITTVGATVSPGDSSTTTGILTDNGNLVLDPNSTFAATLNGTTAGTNYDQLVVGKAGSTINLNNATLNVSLGALFPTGGGQQYTILSNNTGSAVTGTFNGLPEGGQATFSDQPFVITYKGGTSGHDVVLTSLRTTTTTVTPSTTGPVSGQSVTLTVTVTPLTGTGTPTGSVTFTATQNGTSTTLGTVTLSSGTATLPTTKLATGTNTITATYSGDSTFGTSTSAGVSVVVAQASSTLTLTASPNPSVVNQAVTLTATAMAVAPGAGTPTGTVTFFNGSTSLGTANLASGVAVLTTTSLPLGTDSITAVYAGDTNFITSTSQAVSQVIVQGAAAVSISTSNPNPFALQAITLTAVVSMTSGTGTPTGTVTFQTAGGTTLGTATLTSGQASLTINTIPLGQQSIVAVYSGDSNFLGATSPGLSIVVGHPTDLYINQIYQDLFGSPASFGATYWIALLNAGYDRKPIVRQILQSAQAKDAAVEQVYLSLLGRQATPQELNRATSSGNRSTIPLYSRVFGSKEFYQTQGQGTVDGFLTALALDWFGKPFSSAVQARLARQIAHGTSRTEVAHQVITSPSGVHAQVNSIFETVLGRPASARDLKTFSPLVSEGNLVAVYEALFTSREFIAKSTKIV